MFEHWYTQRDHIEHLLGHVLRNQGKMMSDFSHLQESLDAVKAETAKAVALLQKLAGMKGNNDQATIDALAAEADDILSSLSTADAAAADPTPAPVTDPAPAPADAAPAAPADAPAADPASAPAP